MYVFEIYANRSNLRKISVVTLLLPLLIDYSNGCRPSGRLHLRLGFRIRILVIAHNFKDVLATDTMGVLHHVLLL
jgi:hypothetical protein